MEGLERWALDEVPIASFQAPYKSVLRSFPLNRGAVVGGGNLKSANAIDLQSGDEVRVPFYAVKLYDGKESLQDKPWFASTNGMSAGNSREEAILSGLYEVIERDGVHLAMERTRAGTMLSRVNQDSIEDPECLELLHRIEEAGSRVFIYDTRNELNIPTFQCLLVDQEKGLGIFKGYRCNSDKWIALCGSICEAAQSRAVIFAGARDDITWARHRKLIADSVNNNWISLLDSEQNVVSMDEIPSTGDPLPILWEHGMNALVVDFPIPDAPFVCLKVMVPGFAGYWLPYAEPGRPNGGGV
jgi:YcaO-like protein with predicted kinase domain